MLDRDEAIFRLYLLKNRWPNLEIRRSRVRTHITKESTSFALFRLRVTFGVLVRTIRMEIL